VSAKLRTEAEALRAKYSRVQDIAIEHVEIVWMAEDDTNAALQADGCPMWTLAAGAPSWVHRVAAERQMRERAPRRPRKER
jgi:hypothetical protein